VNRSSELACSPCQLSSERWHTEKSRHGDVTAPGNAFYIRAPPACVGSRTASPTAIGSVKVVHSLVYLLPPPAPPPAPLPEPVDCVAVLGFADDAPVPVIAPLDELLVMPVVVWAVPAPVVPDVPTPVEPVVPMVPPVAPPLLPLDVCAITAPASVSANTLARTILTILT
jgi:hypothetical protein